MDKNVVSSSPCVLICPTAFPALVLLWTCFTTRTWRNICQGPRNAWAGGGGVEGWESRQERRWRSGANSFRRDFWSHQSLRLHSLLQGDINISGPYRRCPVTTGLYLEDTRTTGIQESRSSSPQAMAWKLLWRETSLRKEWLQLGSKTSVRHKLSSSPWEGRGGGWGSSERKEELQMENRIKSFTWVLYKRND